MRSIRPTSFLVGAAVLALAACGGDTAEMGEAEGGEAAAPEAAPAQTASAQDTGMMSECFVRGSMDEAGQRPSPLQTTVIPVGDTTAVLCYGAPSARDREIMGGLVPWDTPWRMGANEATAIHLPVAATIGGVELEPGSYSLWAEPGEEEWTIHINENHERWGIPISDEVQAADVGTFTLQPETRDDMTETLTYEWHEGMGHLLMTWENTRLHIPVSASGSGM